MDNANQALAYIHTTIETLPPALRVLCGDMLSDTEFQRGFGAKSHHHNFEGGLLIHTAEVLQNCLSVNLEHLNREVLIVAAVWHDYLKKKDYVKVDYPYAEGGAPNYRIDYTEYKQMIYHISGSWAEFYHQAKLLNIDENFIEKVGHCLLSHHGRPEWGSPITPQTPEALVLHWADCMSAWFENGKYKAK